MSNRRLPLDAAEIEAVVALAGAPAAGLTLTQVNATTRRTKRDDREALDRLIGRDAVTSRLDTGLGISRYALAVKWRSQLDGAPETTREEALAALTPAQRAELDADVEAMSRMSKPELAALVPRLVAEAAQAELAYRARWS